MSPVTRNRDKVGFYIWWRWLSIREKIEDPFGSIWKRHDRSAGFITRLCRLNQRWNKRWMHTSFLQVPFLFFVTKLEAVRHGPRGSREPPMTFRHKWEKCTVVRAHKDRILGWDVKVESNVSRESINVKHDPRERGGTCRTRKLFDSWNSLSIVIRKRSCIRRDHYSL